MSLIRAETMPEAWELDRLIQYLSRVRDRFGGGITNTICLTVLPDEEGRGVIVSFRADDGE